MDAPFSPFSDFPTLSSKFCISPFNLVISSLLFISNQKCAPILPLFAFSPTLSFPWFTSNTPLTKLTSSLGAYMIILLQHLVIFIGSSTLPELDERLILVDSSSPLIVYSVSTTCSSNQEMPASKLFEIFSKRNVFSSKLEAVPHTEGSLSAGRR